MNPFVLHVFMVKLSVLNKRVSRVGVLHSYVKRPEREWDPSALTTAEVDNGKSYIYQNLIQV
jgi:hypothetical protein